MEIVMKVSELEKKASLYKVAKVLGLTAPAVYKWREKDKVPDLRVYQLKEKMPEWFIVLTPA
jgi:predicted transcriptional regulator